MALVGRRAQAARAETSNGGHVKTVGGTKVATGPNGNTAVKQTKAGVGKILCCFYLFIILYIVWFSNTSICCNDLSYLFITPSPLPIIRRRHKSISTIAHGENGTAAGKQTKVAVKTNNGVKTAQKTTAGAYREKKE